MSASLVGSEMCIRDRTTPSMSRGGASGPGRGSAPLRSSGPHSWGTPRRGARPPPGPWSRGSGRASNSTPRASTSPLQRLQEILRGVADFVRRGFVVKRRLRSLL
eukprot:2660721-Alexandrium_andersonii.AAC.1